MSGSEPIRRGASVETPDVRPRATGQVTTTIMLPAEAFTLVAPPPEMLSQLNVEHVLGIPARTYLELLREPDCSVTVTCVGKLRLVDRNKFRSWLEGRGKAKRAAAAAGAAANETAPDDDQLTAEEQVKLGIKPAPRTAAGRR